MDSARTRTWLRNAAFLLDRDKDRLTRLDSAIGDGDHGVNMHRGFSAVAAALDEDDRADVTAGELLVAAGNTLVSTIGGASGPLFGSSFRALGKTLDGPSPQDEKQRLAAALAAASDSVHRLGAADPGDKTMYDVYRPAAAAFAPTEGLGSLIGATLTPRLAGRIGSGRMLLVSTLFGASVAVLMPLAGRGWGLLLFALGNIGFGAGVVVLSILTRTHRQTVTPPELLPRVMATVRFVSWGAVPFGALTAGAVAMAIGNRGSLWLICALAFLAPLAVWTSPIRRMRDLT